TAVPVTPKKTAPKSATTAGVLMNPGSPPPGTFVSGRGRVKRRGSRKGATAKITFARGTGTARDPGTLNQPLVKREVTHQAAMTPPRAMIRHVSGRRHRLHAPTRFWPALTDS